MDKYILDIIVFHKLHRLMCQKGSDRMIINEQSQKDVEVVIVYLKVLSYHLP